MDNQQFVINNDLTEDLSDISDSSDHYSQKSIDSIKANNSDFNEQKGKDPYSSQRSTPASLNAYPILPPIQGRESSLSNDENQPKRSRQKKEHSRVLTITELQQKYHALDNDKSFLLTSDNTNDLKLDDAYLKMKRLDKALEEAIEKERQVKIETMSLMKKLRNEMQSMTVAINQNLSATSDLSESKTAQMNLKRFLALDDELLKLDGGDIMEEDIMSGEPFFKTQPMNDPLDESIKSKKSSLTTTSQNGSVGDDGEKKSAKEQQNRKTKKNKTVRSEKDFIKRNILLAKEMGGAYALTDDEKQRLKEILEENDDSENITGDTTTTLCHPSQPGGNGYEPTIDELKRLTEIDDILEKEYYNPLLNHQLRRKTNNDENDQQFIDYNQLLLENDEDETRYGEPSLKETRLQREHSHRLKEIEERLEQLHQPMNEENKIEAVLTDEQLQQLLGQCFVDEMKDRFTLTNRDNELTEFDVNDLTDYTLMRYVDDNRGPMITDDIIQCLIEEAREEGIEIKQYDDPIDDGNNDVYIKSALQPYINENIVDDIDKLLAEIRPKLDAEKDEEVNDTKDDKELSLAPMSDRPSSSSTIVSAT